MGLDFQIVIRTKDGGKDEIINIQIDDELLRKLKLYKESCDKLYQSAYFLKERKASFNFRYDETEHSFVFNCEAPTDQVLDGLVLRLRPFLLENEPTNFNRITNELKRLLQGTVFEQKITNIKKKYRVDFLNGMKFKINGTEIVSEAMLFKWLNGYYYHLDKRKRDDLSEIYLAFPEEGVRTIFIDMLGDKITHIFEIGNLIIFLLGLEKEIKFNI